MAHARGSPYAPRAITLTDPTVIIGGLAARVLFTGLAPGSVGLYQVNVEIPAGVTQSAAAPVALSIGGVSSNTVAIAVH